MRYSPALIGLIELSTFIANHRRDAGPSNSRLVSGVIATRELTGQRTPRRDEGLGRDVTSENGRVRVSHRRILPRG